MLSTITCIVLQVNVTKITIGSGLTLGEHLLSNFQGRNYIPIAVGGSVVFGCIAFQVGNLLGAVLGLELILSVHQQWIILAIVLIASVLLWFGTTEFIVQLLGMVVAFMGFIFLYIVFSMELDFNNPNFNCSWDWSIFSFNWRFFSNCWRRKFNTSTTCIA